MCEKLQKIESLKKELSSCCGTCADRHAALNLVHDLELLVKSESSAERAWELAMMALVGTDGPGGAKHIISKLISVIESIGYMSPEMAASSAPEKARLVLELISEEKRLARG